MTPRIERLLSKLHAEAASAGTHLLRSKREQDAFVELGREVYAVKREGEASDKAAFLEAFAQRIPVEVDANELIVGSQRFIADVGHRNHGHVIVDYGRFLRHGVDGMKKLVADMPESVNKGAFAKALNAFAVYILRHASACEAIPGMESSAEVCRKIAHAAPETFHEALQLVWFMQVFLHAEGAAAAVSFGRFDKFMAPYFKERESAKELLSCFFLKTCEGDESQNLTVGGEESELSLLCLEVMAELEINQPSLSVRLHEGSSKRFREAAAKLALQGHGQPSFVNQPVVVEALKAAGVPEARAEDFGIVGCYEASPQGDTLPLTVIDNMNLPGILMDFLGGDAKASSFEELLADFKSYFVRFCKETKLPAMEARLENLRKTQASPFESVCIKGCVESGLCAEEGGAELNLYGVNIMGLGTLIDSLAALKRLVFDERRFALPEFLAQVKANFPDEALRSLCTSLPEKFGRDDALTNSLAEDLSNFIADQVLSLRVGKFRPDPSFFFFGQDILTGRYASTPDGRRNGERLSYGCGPSEIAGLSATSVLKSAAHVAHKKCACGNPLKLAFKKGDLNSRRLLELLDGYFKLGGFQLHVNIMDAQALKEAQAKPEEHQSLTVRISGFSAVFVKLNKTWQDALVSRTEKGL